MMDGGEGREGLKNTKRGRKERERERRGGVKLRWRSEQSREREERQKVGEGRILAARDTEVGGGIGRWRREGIMRSDTSRSS